MKLNKTLYLIDPDKNYKIIGTLDHCVSSFNWTEDMLTESGGSFSITLKGGALRSILKKELLVMNTKGYKLGFVTTIKYKKNKGEIEETIISGKMAEHILERRCVKKQMQLQGKIKNIIKDLINRNVINTKSTVSNIPMTIKFIGTMPTEDTEYAFEAGEKVSAAMNSICLNANIFYYFTIEDNGLVLNIKTCEDKSNLVFASDDSNLYDITIIDTIENKANCVIVQGDVINESIPYSYSVLSGTTGIHVCESFIDASNVDSQDIKSSTYLKMLKKAGNTQLMNYQIRRAFDAATLKNKYKYPTEIFLGDILTLDIEGEKEQQRLTSFLHCVNSSNKEEMVFTLTQLPKVVSSDDEYIYEPVPDDQLDELTSDATSTGANKVSSGGVEIIGRVLCDGNESVDGTIQKLGNGLYRVNIYAWNGNKTNETTGNEIKVPYTGKIYFQCSFDILSNIKNTTNTIDIDNFDGSKTRIDISSAQRGALYKDKLMDEQPLIFENLGEWNSGAPVAYAYDIKSENLNFDTTFVISTSPVLDTVPAKDYNRNYGFYICSCMAAGTGNDTTRTLDFIPDNFYADDGDTLTLICNYAPIIHNNDASNPYSIDNKNLQRMELTWTFKEGELVKNKIIRLPEGYYDFVGGSDWGLFSNFKKLNHLKEVQTGVYSNAGKYGRGIIATANTETGVVDAGTNANGMVIIRQDPALDKNVSDIKWLFYHVRLSDKLYVDLTKVYKPVRFFLCTQIQSGGNNNPGGYNLPDPQKSLETLCEDPQTWIDVLAEKEATT